jgi:hypothetical protein
MREQADQHGALAWPRQRDESTVDEHLEGPEKSVHGRHGATLHRIERLRGSAGRFME